MAVMGEVAIFGDEQDDVGTEVPSKLVIEFMTAMPASAVKLAIREVAMVPHSSAAQGCQGSGQHLVGC